MLAYKGHPDGVTNINIEVFVNGCVCVFFLSSEVDEVGTGNADDVDEETSANQMAGKSPNFCVLLHGSLKVEGMVALVQLG